MSGCSNTTRVHSTVRRIRENRRLSAEFCAQTCRQLSAEFCAQTCYLQMKLHQGLVLRPSCVPEKVSINKMDVIKKFP